MYIEAVTVCLEYDDFLEVAIRQNQGIFDEWVVVTAQYDKGTRAVCERYGVRVAFCPYFKRHGAKFNKALAINIGLAHLKLSDWIVHIDADMILPRGTRRHLRNVELDPTCIYGIDRVMCPSYEAWHEHLLHVDKYEKHYFGKPPHNWHVGTRLLHHDYGGYCPLGATQLWNRESGITRYPTVQDADAEHTDILHSLQWPRTHRVLIPEIYGIHIGTGGPNMGANWHGRTTPRWGPTPKPGPKPDPKPDANCDKYPRK